MKKVGEEKTGLFKKVESINVSRILRELPRNVAFYFFTSTGNYTGECAMSLGDFVGKIKELDIKSIEFHLYREDFEKWVTETLEDKELAQEIEKLRKQNLSGESLRQKLHAVVSKRHEQLQRML
ncbi:MAG: DUF5752 family protein [Candidatus Bathyarchaeota archaeon]|nr:DUF5752 family protein [Candidatus Bathyarchaeota archaeon]